MSKVRNRWWIVVASTLGLIVGQSTVNGKAVGVLMKPMSEDLGIGRGEFSTAVALGTVITAIASPFFGRLLDRYGIRPITLPAIALFALSTAAFSLLSSSLSLFFLFYALSGITAVGQTSAAYSKSITSWFDKDRGLALGVALSGVGLGTALVPQLVSFSIEQWGWRTAYVTLALSIIVLAFIPVLLFIREPPAVAAQPAVSGYDSRPQDERVPGITLQEAMRGSWNFWALVGAMFIANTAINGSLIHIFPLLTDRGISNTMATAALSAAGVALMVSRIVSGYCLDRFFGPYIAVIFLLIPMTGIGLLLGGFGNFVPFVATIFLGIGIGVEVDLLAFFVGRYFGLRAFGAIYGFLFLGAVAGNAAGSMLLGWCFQLTHTYTPILILFEILLVVACTLLARLGPYSYAAVP